MSIRPQHKQGIVLSGGGALGAFEVGVMRALYEGKSSVTHFQPLVPDVLTGTSVGAYNAAFLAAQGTASGPQAIQRLNDIWLQRIAETPTSCGTAAFRLRTNPFWFDPACLANPVQLFARSVADTSHWAEYAISRTASFLTSNETIPVRLLESINLESAVSPGPLYQLIRDTISSDALRRSTIDLAIAATNWRNGSLEIFNRKDLLSSDGLSAVAASAAIPGLFPPVEVQGVPFIDGGVLQNTPIKPAIRCGADVLHVIFLDPEVCQIPLPEVPNTFATLQRTFAIIQAAAINRDIAMADGIVEELRSLRRKRHLRRDFRTARKTAPEESRAIQRLREGRKPPYRPLTIHRYRPRTELTTPGGFVDFRRPSVEHLIQLGYANAINHDCEREQCTLASDEIHQAKGEHHA